MSSADWPILAIWHFGNVADFGHGTTGTVGQLTHDTNSQQPASGPAPQVGGSGHLLISSDNQVPSYRSVGRLLF